VSNELNHATLRALKYTAGTPGTRLDAYHVVKISDAFTIDLCAGGTGAPDIPYGIVQPAEDDPFNTYLYEASTYTRESYKDGVNASVCCLGECMAMAGTGGFTAGSFVMADASGHVIDHVPGGHILGKAMETATVGKLGRIDVLVNGSADASSLEKQVASANGAITISNGLVIITKAGVCALTLADPTTANNYDRLHIQSNTAQAHTVTADFNGSGSATYTFPAAIGGSIDLMAYGGKWLLPVNIKATTFTGALVGNVTGDCSGSSGSCTGNALTATTASALASAGVFMSTEQTGSGIAQNIPHGLVTDPALAWAVITTPTGNAGDTIAWTKDATNVVVTATATVKYIVFAVK